MAGKRFSEKLSDLLARLAADAAGVVFCALSAVGLYSTCYIFIDFATMNHERVEFHGDSVLLNLAVLALCAFLAALLSKRNVKKSVRQCACAVAVVLPAVLGALWAAAAKAVPGADSRSIISAANALLSGDASALTEGTYFRIFPFQLGYLAFVEGFFGLFGANNLFALSVLNAICVSASYGAILLIARALFADEKVTFLTALLLIGCLQPVFLSTFLYGNLPGLALSLYAVLFTVRYLAGGRAWNALPAAALFALAVTIKMNFMIPVIASVIALLLFALKKRKAAPVLLAAGILALSLFAPRGVQRCYEARFDTSFGEGTPQTAWFAAGLNESSMCSGWFNSYTTSVLAENDFDEARTRAAIRENYSARISMFLHRPRYLCAFFYKKIVSQWNEPAFQSVWSSASGEHASPVSEFVDSLYFRAGERALNAYFNFYVELLYAAFACAMWLLRKDMRPETLIFPLTLFGAFLYHALFEAKSQYVLAYVPMLLPFAAYGLLAIGARLEAARQGRRKRDGN